MTTDGTVTGRTTGPRWRAEDEDEDDDDNSEESSIAGSRFYG